MVNGHFKKCVTWRHLLRNGKHTKKTIQNIYEMSRYRYAPLYTNKGREGGYKITKEISKYIFLRMYDLIIFFKIVTEFLDQQNIPMYICT